MRNLRNFVSAFLGGLSVGIGSIAYLTLKDTSSVIAALMFALGFLAVVIFDFKLFTDRAGAVLEKRNTEEFFKNLFITFIANILGAMLCGFAFRDKVYATAAVLIQATVLGSYLDLFLSSLFAGVVIYIALHGYRKAESSIASCAILVIGVSVIAFCELDYSILNTVLTASGIQTFATFSKHLAKIISAILVSAVGNALGAIIFSSLYKFKNSEGNSKHHKHHKHHHHNKKHESANKETAEEAEI